MKVLFLDIDGVLNDHTFDKDAQSSTLLSRCVAALNRVIDSTDCHLVISSAWRYMVHGEAMTTRGFEYMLRTHGVHAVGRVLGVTRRDEDAPEGHHEPDPTRSSDPRRRTEQVNDWLDLRTDVRRFAVVDDLELPDLPLVRTDGRVGLTEDQADALIALLGEIPETP